MIFLSLIAGQDIDGTVFLTLSETDLKAECFSVLTFGEKRKIMNIVQSLNYMNACDGGLAALLADTVSMSH